MSLLFLSLFSLNIARHENNKLDTQKPQSKTKQFSPAPFELTIIPSIVSSPP